MKETINSLFPYLLSDKKRLVVVLFILLLVGGFLVTMVLFFTKQSTKNSTSSLPPDVGQPGSRSQSFKKTIPASLFLKVKGDKKIYKVHDEITLLVGGDTAGQVIRGYDVVFRYDGSIVSYIKSKSLNGNFDYQQRIRGDWLMITGVHKQTDMSKITLKNDNLVELQFKAEKTGTAYFPLSFVDGRLSDSNLINEKSEDILTEVSGVTIQITP